MYLQISQIVLWPRTGEHQPRVVTLQPGALNVITGVSKTGKSAIIPIIDYCLGSEKCSIPVETIRRACSWFGIVLETTQGQLLMARREPGSQKATGDMFVLEGRAVDVPFRIERNNTNVDAVKVTLNELAGLTQLDFDAAETGSGFKGRPSFRDMTAFTFQPQNIIANANVLFYKADSTEHREKLRTIFPYVLGAVTAEVLALEHEQQRLRVELRKRERELQTLQQLSARWVGEIRGKVSRARELGLLTISPADTASVSDLIAMLRSAVTNADRQPELTAQVLAGAADESVALQREEADASASLARLKQRFADMNRLRDATEDYRGSLSVRRERLQIADWMRGLHDPDHECPLCGSEDTAAREAVEILHRSLQQVEEHAGSVSTVPAAFDREYQRVRDDISRESERVNAIRYHKRALEGRSQEARDRQYQLTSAARFAGSLEEALERYERVAFDSELTNEVAALRDRIAVIETDLRARDIRGAVARAVQKFSVLAGRVLPSLDTEWPNDPIILAIDDLTIKVAREGRDDYLWEIGSGANWLAYHIATSVALHELFRDLKTSAVPSFVVYDQPSQVYFPKRARAADSTTAVNSPDESPGKLARALDGAGGEIDLTDEDVRAVRKVFVTLAEAVQRGAGAWQAIVLDHASDDIWGDIPGVHLVEEWRGGRNLVPTEWLG